MRKAFLRALSLLPLLVLLNACQNPPPSEEDCGFVKNAFDRRVSWAQLPVQFYADDSLSWQQIKAVEEAMAVWNAQFDGPALQLIGRTEKLPAPRVNNVGRVIPDGYNGIYVVEKSVFENTSVKDEQARTSISFRGDFIYEADILIDGSEKFYFDDEVRAASTGEVQFKSLMIHELGHALGLGHVEEQEVQSVMNPRLNYGQLRNDLSDIDKSALTCEYQ